MNQCMGLRDAAAKLPIHRLRFGAGQKKEKSNAYYGSEASLPGKLRLRNSSLRALKPAHP